MRQQETPHQTTLDEKGLLEGAQASRQGFAALFDAYYMRLYKFAFRRVSNAAVAEDIVAQVFEEALRGIHRVHWEGKPVGAWLYRIAGRRITDWRRRAGQSVTLELDDDKLAGPESGISQVDEFDALRRGLDRLSKRDLEIILLSFFDEMEAGEMAALFQCSVNNVYIRLHRALKRLRVIMEQEAGDA